MKIQPEIEQTKNVWTDYFNNKCNKINLLSGIATTNTATYLERINTLNFFFINFLLIIFFHKEKNVWGIKISMYISLLQSFKSKNSFYWNTTQRARRRKLLIYWCLIFKSMLWQKFYHKSMSTRSLEVLIKNNWRFHFFIFVNFLSFFY